MTHYLIIKHAHISRDLQTDYPKIDISTLEFKKGYIEASWECPAVKNEVFEVLLCMNYDISKKGNILCAFVKPIKPYECSEFETLFGFGPHCENYDENKIIAIEHASKNGIIDNFVSNE